MAKNEPVASVFASAHTHKRHAVKQMIIISTVTNDCLHRAHFTKLDQDLVNVKSE